jgi:RNA polymerase sigma-54 factor
MLKQSLSQKMLQKLSPQQIQLMKLLQVPTATLEQRIKEELEANPALEESEDYSEVFDLEESRFGANESPQESGDGQEEQNFEFDDYLNQYLDDDPSNYKLKGEGYANEDEKSVPISFETSYHENLERQLGMLNLSEREGVIALQIIGSIDEDGYLRRDPASITDDLLFAQNLEVSKSEVEAMIKKIQRFEPAGICARDLQECLLLQIRDKIEKDPSDHNKTIALVIISEYFEEFSKKHYDKIKKQLSLSDSELKDAIEVIIKLNPKPAGAINSSSVNQYIIPDFIVMNRDGELELTLNSKNAPDLRINDQYLDMLKGYRETVSGRKATKPEKEAVLFIKQKIDSAKWFIDAIKQRQDTLYRTMYSIMQYQREYFLTGDERRIKPMILKDLAEVTGLDISTVSRVANSKFVQTEFGTKRLKDFFSESMQTQDGSEVSTLEVKNILNDVISREDKSKPLSDEKLMEILSERGYNIARRTIAKYREQLNIPVARLRKQL